MKIRGKKLSALTRFSFCCGSGLFDAKETRSQDRGFPGPRFHAARDNRGDPFRRREGVLLPDRDVPLVRVYMTSGAGPSSTRRRRRLAQVTGMACAPAERLPEARSSTTT